MANKLLIFLIILEALIVGSCASKHGFNFKPRLKPVYNSIDERAKPYVQEFFSLSKQNNITFSKNATLGFNTIDRGNVIGVCFRGFNFREIEIDDDFFQHTSEIRRKALMFHELTHCYCDRSHDFADGKSYPESVFMISLDKIKANIPWSLARVPPGYFEDGCATSIMHPDILDNQCLQDHWEHYIKEMFDRCDPI